MRLVILLSLLSRIYAQTSESKLFCYYNSGSFLREGFGKFQNTDLEVAVQFCTHVIYGYLGLKGDTYQVYSLQHDLDINKNHFTEVVALKRKYPHLKVLLSVGGEYDNNGNSDDYINLLENKDISIVPFINTAQMLLRQYGFDGLDLAFQFPKNKPRKVHSEIGQLWKKIKKVFTGDFIVDPKAEEHREEFTYLVRELRNALRPDNLMLTLTVLPNVNSSWYFDVKALSDTVDYVNLAAFDFLTPQRNPEEADYTAPLYEQPGQDRLPHLNADFQVTYWLSRQFPANKLILGMATYGRSWKMTADSGTTGVPVVPNTNGPADAGRESQMPGLLSWPEICDRLPNAKNAYEKGANAPLKRIGDPTKRYGTYAYRPANADGDHGIWISYDDPESAANKAGYVRSKGLAGLSLFDLSYDDFRGTCTGDRFPMLRAAKYRL